VKPAKRRNSRVVNLWPDDPALLEGRP
jgi:hypothetical protein